MCTSDDGPPQSGLINAYLSIHYNISELLQCLTSGKCYFQQPLLLILTTMQYICVFRGPVKMCRQAGRSPGRLQYGCQSRRVTVWLIRALLICTALISRLSLLQSGSSCACAGMHMRMCVCIFSASSVSPCVVI